MANLGWAAQEVGTARRTKRNNLPQRAVSSWENNRERLNVPGDEVGRAEIGAAWSKRSEEGRDTSHSSTRPPFKMAILCNLFDEEGDEGSFFAWRP
ncbi:uncharacterized protein (DUF736 family) [Bradyrhizobium sp. USDA 4518]